LRRLSVALSALVFAGLPACEPSPPSERGGDAAAPPTDSGHPATWSPVVGPLPPIILSAWGPDADTVYFAGGLSGATGGVVARWRRGGPIALEAIPPGRPLWWVFGAGPAHVWAVGEGGRILRREANAWREETVALDDRAQLWGGFAVSPTDLWAVGGSVRRGGPKGLVLRSQGDGQWTRVEDTALPTDANLYKVWAASAEDVHVVGENGLALHFDGTTLRRVSTPTRDLLFTVHGQPGGLVLAVGGTIQGVALRWTPDGWVDDRPPMTQPLNGVYVRPDGTALASGARGVLLERDTLGRWSPVAVAIEPSVTLHAVFAGAAAWAVGGALDRGEGGYIATTEAPPPAVDLTPPPPPSETGDAGPALDAAPRVDASPALSDAAEPTTDSAVAPIDASRPVPDATVPVADSGLDLDARAADAAPPPADAAPPPDDASPPVDAAFTPADAPPPPVDAAPLPGPAESCENAFFLCSEGFDCYDVIVPNIPAEALCLQACSAASECDPAFGAAPCCARPGPQLLSRYCVPADFFPGGCP